jgi:hypothetical protein
MGVTLRVSSNIPVKAINHNRAIKATSMLKIPRSAGLVSMIIPEIVSQRVKTSVLIIRKIVGQIYSNV